ncbi:MAG: aminoglycoside phosphotransferase family protein [Paracoccaceae bacterium]
MSATDPRLAAFLAQAGVAGAALAPLAGDASMRRYLRVHPEHGSGLVLMDAPRPLNERMDAFVAVTDWLRAAGLSAPQVVAADLDEGLLLLEDLGDALYARVLARDPAAEPALYGAAVDLLARLPRTGAADAPLGIGPYDLAVLGREARLAVDWWADGAGRALPPEAVAEFDALVAEAVAPAAPEAARTVTVLRDYHAENLLWLPERRGAARVGLLDYQDALVGHPAYDLVSLLEDARRDVAPDLAEAMIARYAAEAGLGATDATAFRDAYDALGAQRNLKIVGIFARLALRDAKPRYLGLIPRVWGHLRRDLASARLAPLAAFVERWIPEPDAAALARVAVRARAAEAASAEAGA